MELSKIKKVSDLVGYLNRKLDFNRFYDDCSFALKTHVSCAVCDELNEDQAFRRPEGACAPIEDKYVILYFDQGFAEIAKPFFLEFNGKGIKSVQPAMLLRFFPGDFCGEFDSEAERELVENDFVY